MNKEGMRQRNIHLVFETIYRNEGITRTQLVAKTKMSEMTVGRTVDFLLKNGMIFDRLSENTNDVGRPASHLYLNQKIVNVGLSLDPGGAFIGLVDPYGKMLQFREHRFNPESMTPERTLEIAAELIETFIADYVPGGVHAVGMVMPGLIDCQLGLVRFSSQLKWKDVPVLDILKKYPNIPDVVLDNDIKARALGENRFGPGKKSKCSVLLNIGSGVGAGIIIDGKIYRGNENFAGEIGHTVLSTNNRICECGRKGCLEATISQPAVLREARAIEPHISFAGLEAAYKEEVLWAKTLLNMTAENILMVVHLLATMYAPDVIVLCGSLMDQCAVLRQILFDSYKEQHAEMFNHYFDLEFSKFGPDGNLIGAAALALIHNITQVIADPASSKTVLSKG